MIEEMSPSVKLKNVSPLKSGICVLAMAFAGNPALVAQVPRPKPPPPGLSDRSLRPYRIGVFSGKDDPARMPGAADETGAQGSGGPQYAQHFARSGTGYLTAQVTFENGRFGENEFTYEVMVGLYTYDNRPISANKKKMVVAADWKYAWTSQSYGWDEPGKWSVGTYRVKAWVNGELAGETAFYVFDDKADPEALRGEAEIEIDKLDLFEGGEFFRPGLTKTASTTFSRRTTRRIYWVARAKNRLHEVRAQHPNVIGYFYRPDGTLMGETPNRFLIAPEVKDIVLVEGIGWPTPGNWDVGTYRFELEQNNRLVAERSFEVTDRFQKEQATAKVVHYGMIDGGVFAGSITLPGDDPGRVYEKVFSGATLSYVWAEIVVANNPNHTEAHSHKARWEFLGPNGVLLGQVETDFTILPEWKTARQRASAGFDDPKKWVKGHYKVRVSIDGRLEKVLRFEVR
jgi:hypothetical protein